MFRTYDLPHDPSGRPRKRILLIDDNAMNLDYLTKAVRKAGYEPVAVESAAKAFKVLTETPIDMVITDLAMPFVHGFDVITRLRQIPSFAHLPVIVCSAMKTANDVRRAATLRVHSYIVKPIERSYLLARIAAALQEPEADASPPSQA